MIHDVQEFQIRERGRKHSSSFHCNAYFEVISTPPGITHLEVYALNDAGIVLGKGDERRSSNLEQGMLFEVLLFTQADQIAYWQIQAGNYISFKHVCRLNALTNEQYRYASKPVKYVEPPSDVLDVVHALPKLKNDWKGSVVGSIRSGFFHHADCRKARALKPENRQEYSDPQPAWDKGLRPCFDCLFALP